MQHRVSAIKENQGIKGRVEMMFIEESGMEDKSPAGGYDPLESLSPRHGSNPEYNIGRCNGVHSYNTGFLQSRRIRASKAGWR
jgi:hypothetical protein